MMRHAILEFINGETVTVRWIRVRGEVDIIRGYKADVLNEFFHGKHTFQIGLPEPAPACTASYDTEVRPIQTVDEMLIVACRLGDGTFEIANVRVVDGE